MTHDHPRRLKPAAASSGYILTFSLGCFGLFCVACALGSIVLLDQKQPAETVFDSYGLAAFLFAAAMLFVVRIIFWDRATERVRIFTRWLVTVVLCGGLVATVPAAILAWRMPAASAGVSLPRFFAVGALLCQMGSVVWLIRYRREPDQAA